jgi:hypothetical protein
MECKETGPRRKPKQATDLFPGTVSPQNCNESISLPPPGWVEW